MRIEIWLDFLNKEAYLLHLELEKMLEENDFPELEILYRSYPTRETKDKTINAHRLAHYAKRQNKAFLYHKTLLELLFQKNKPINNETLIEVSSIIGLPIDEVVTILENTQFYDVVQQNFENALFKGINSIPHLRINGSLKKDGIVNAEQICLLLKEEPKNKTTHCIDGVCRRTR